MHNHPNLDARVNSNIAQSEIEGGVYVLDHPEHVCADIKARPVLPIGGQLEIQTENTCYRLIKISKDRFLIQGNAKYCPVPTGCNVHGSTWGGFMLKVGFVGRGMHLEFSTPKHSLVTTSRIKEIHEAVPKEKP